MKYAQSIFQDVLVPITDAKSLLFHTALSTDQSSINTPVYKRFYLWRVHLKWPHQNIYVWLAVVWQALRSLNNRHTSVKASGYTKCLRANKSCFKSAMVEKHQSLAVLLLGSEVCVFFRAVCVRGCACCVKEVFLVVREEWLMILKVCLLVSQVALNIVFCYNSIVAFPVVLFHLVIQTVTWHDFTSQTSHVSGSFLYANTSVQIYVCLFFSV